MASELAEKRSETDQILTRTKKQTDIYIKAKKKIIFNYYINILAQLFIKPFHKQYVWAACEKGWPLN